MSTALQNTTEREFLRHTLATVAYRGLKSVLGAPDEFGEFRPGPTSRSAVEILAHIGDLLQWGIFMDQGEWRWEDHGPLGWPEEVQRFQRLLKEFDQQLSRPSSLSFGVEKLFQGPIADSLNHIGQINMMRRLAGYPVRGESYARANIRIGFLEPDTTSKRVEFD